MVADSLVYLLYFHYNFVLSDKTSVKIVRHTLKSCSCLENSDQLDKMNKLGSF